MDDHNKQPTRTTNENIKQAPTLNSGKSLRSMDTRDK